MKNFKLSTALFLSLILISPLTSSADECMEGDCNDGVGTGFTDEGYIYKGEWKDGLPHGKGKLTISKKKIIEGLFVKGKLKVDKKDD